MYQITLGYSLILCRLVCLFFKLPYIILMIQSNIVLQRPPTFLQIPKSGNNICLTSWIITNYFYTANTKKLLHLELDITTSVSSFSCFFKKKKKGTEGKKKKKIEYFIETFSLLHKCVLSIYLHIQLCMYVPCGLKCYQQLS